MQRNPSGIIPYNFKNKIASENKQFMLSKSQSKSLNFFCNGFIFYTLSFVASNINTILSPALCQAFEAIGLIIIISGAIKLISFKFDNRYLEIVFTVYIIFSITIVLRGGKYDYDTIKTLLFNMLFSAFAYIAPLVILFPRNLLVYKKVVKVTITFGIFSLFFVMFYYKILRSYTWQSNESQGYVEVYFFCLAFPIGFLLLTYIYYDSKQKWFAFMVMIISLYLLIFRARRGAMFMCASTLASVVIIYLIYTKRRILVISLSILLFLVGSVFVANIKLPHMFDSLMARKDDDTRTYVEESMKADMKPIEWAIGKGINGTYFCPGIDEKSDINGQRYVIETGYLQIILKGGIVSFSLLGLILLPAIYLGFFRSINILSKGAAMFILLWVLYLYPATSVSGFSIYYIILWLGVGICYSPKIRNLSDSVIKEYLYK